MTEEDDEFTRIAMEQRVRAKQQEVFGIPFITQEELQELLKYADDAIQTPSDT